VIDIIVRAKDGHELTRSCLDSILRETPEGAYRLIYVDDGSENVEEAASLGAMADTYIRHARCRGAVSASNSGLAASLLLDGEYVIVMDNDTEIPSGDKGWLERFVAEMERYPDTGAVGATTNYANPPQHILACPQSYTANWEKGTKENEPVVWFISFCVMLRKSAVRQVGWWDERYNPGNWEDTDYAMALRLSGWKIRVARSVYVHHHGHKTFGDRLQKLLLDNRKKFLEKWGPGRCWDMGLMPTEDVIRLARLTVHE